MAQRHVSGKRYRRGLLTAKEKEQKLLLKIEQAKKSLSKLQQQRKMEIGSLAFKHGLNGLHDHQLDQAFEKLAH